MWTEERVELLKKLWGDGLAASQIANRLGETTRNAVIGKVHRLGLAGRATTSRIRAPRPRQPVRLRPVAAATAASTAPRVQFRMAGNTALKPAFAPVEQKSAALALVPPPIKALAMPSILGVALLDLTEGMCRWPIGDPHDQHFHFCGCQAASGAFCEHHARIAYQPYVRRTKK